MVYSFHSGSGNYFGLGSALALDSVLALALVLGSALALALFLALALVLGLGLAAGLAFTRARGLGFVVAAPAAPWDFIFLLVVFLVVFFVAADFLVVKAMASNSCFRISAMSSALPTYTFFCASNSLSSCAYVAESADLFRDSAIASFVRVLSSRRLISDRTTPPLPELNMRDHRAQRHALRMARATHRHPNRKVGSNARTPTRTAAYVAMDLLLKGSSVMCESNCVVMTLHVSITPVVVATVREVEEDKGGGDNEGDTRGAFSNNFVEFVGEGNEAGPPTVSARSGASVTRGISLCGTCGTEPCDDKLRVHIPDALVSIFKKIVETDAGGKI